MINAMVIKAAFLHITLHTPYQSLNCPAAYSVTLDYNTDHEMQMTRNTSQLLTRGPLHPRSRSQNVTNNSGSAATLVTRARVRMRDGKHLSAVSCDQ